MFSEQQDKWLKRVKELFFRYGIKSLTMDDVARELGISKKTLYQFVENKDDLVDKVMDRHIQEECKREGATHAMSTDAIDEMMYVIQYLKEDFQEIKPNVIFEMQKYHREAWDKVAAFQREYIYKVAKANLERGRLEGLYRTDFDIDMAAKFYIITTSAIFDESWFPRAQYKFDILFKEAIVNYLHAVVSDKGRAVLQSKLT
jgi:TetR/AcrR family transcriptional regulator, cholesterol catabolism regulator